MEIKEKILPNIEYSILHFKLPKDIQAALHIYKHRNGFKSKDAAAEFIFRKECMGGINSTEDILANNDISIRTHKPLNLNS